MASWMKAAKQKNLVKNSEIHKNTRKLIQEHSEEILNMETLSYFITIMGKISIGK